MVFDDRVQDVVGGALHDAHLAVWRDLWARLSRYDATNERLRSHIVHCLAIPGVHGTRRQSLHRMLVELESLRSPNEG